MRLGARNNILAILDFDVLNTIGVILTPIGPGFNRVALKYAIKSADDILCCAPNDAQKDSVSPIATELATVVLV